MVLFAQTEPSSNQLELCIRADNLRHLAAEFEEGIVLRLVADQLLRVADRPEPIVVPLLAVSEPDLRRRGTKVR